MIQFMKSYAEFLPRHRIFLFTNPITLFTRIVILATSVCISHVYRFKLNTKLKEKGFMLYKTNFYRDSCYEGSYFRINEVFRCRFVMTHESKPIHLMPTSLAVFQNAIHFTECYANSKFLSQPT